VTKNTIEERILRRAQQKQNVQKTVYSGEVFKANFFNSNEVVNLFFDEDELTQHKKDLKMAKDKAKIKKGKNEKNLIQEKSKKENEKKSEHVIDRKQEKNIKIEKDVTSNLTNGKEKTNKINVEENEKVKKVNGGGCNGIVIEE
jgi:DNA helicase INO80